MNFLAHIYLSGEDDGVRLGNFIGDWIRGKKYLNYPQRIQKGILLHREIDTFTDAHPVFRTSKHRLRPTYGLYSGIIIDIFYDHYLAKHWKKYSEVTLRHFVDDFYQLLKDQNELLPSKVQRMAVYMVDGDWLYNYQYLEGMENVLQGMNRRTEGRSKMNLAIKELQEHYTLFEAEFFTFFEELRLFSQQKLSGS